MGEFRDREDNFSDKAETPSAPVPPAPSAPADPTPASPTLPTHLHQVHAASLEESRRLAARLTALAPSFHDPEEEDCDEGEAEAELLSVALAQRLDAAARAVQAAQRRAFEAGEAPPLDPRGTVAETGLPASLATLQYDLLGGATLDTDGIRVPAPRFRLNVTVPVLSLLGGSQEPGMLEGTIPIPVTMARELAGQSRTWYRVLTDPCSGIFLPLPAERYAPSRAMLEHLRLRNSSCAVPGCARPVSWASEADHIEEYDHEHPERGGLTEIENLHLLCWQHHLLKTLGLLDPTRLPCTPGLPGRTAWAIEDRLHVIVRDNEDLATPPTVRALMDSWTRHQAQLEARRRALERRKNPPPPPF